jgi:hypothetical protein
VATEGDKSAYNAFIDAKDILATARDLLHLGTENGPRRARKTKK